MCRGKAMAHHDSSTNNMDRHACAHAGGGLYNSPCPPRGIQPNPFPCLPGFHPSCLIQECPLYGCLVLLLDHSYNAPPIAAASDLLLLNQAVKQRLEALCALLGVPRLAVGVIDIRDAEAGLETLGPLVVVEEGLFLFVSTRLVTKARKKRKNSPKPCTP